MPLVTTSNRDNDARLVDIAGSPTLLAHEVEDAVANAGGTCAGLANSFAGTVTKALWWLYNVSTTPAKCVKLEYKLSIPVHQQPELILEIHIVAILVER